ncbi:MAG: hypothetical protein AAF961_19000, partial [Planctomycetota bacterium]
MRIAAIVALFAVAGQAAFAQQTTVTDQLTVEKLIGSAVSLSNQEYPEIEQAIQRFLNRDMAGA